MSFPLKVGACVVVCLFALFGVWFAGSSNPVTPAGYAGYLTKGSGLSALRATLEEVVFANVSAAPHEAPQIVQQLHRLLSSQVAKAPPTPQQQAVLDLAADGLTYHEIGARLFISESTVRFHIQNLKSRFGARSKTDLIAKAIQAGFVKPPDERFRGNV